MERSMRSRLPACVLGIVGLIISLALAGDVTVQQGNLSGTNLILTGHAGITDWLEVGTDIEVEDDVYADSCVYAYATVTDVVATDGLLVEGIGLFVDDVKIYGALDVYGKFSPEGGIDPPYLLCDKQTRQEIIEKVRKEVPPEKQGGAALFFNADNHQLETYVPAEGKFYNLSGTVVQTLPAVIAPATQYKPWHHLDRESGQVKSSPKPVSNRYQLKSGCRLDEATGQLINEHTGEAVPREQAVEVYNPSDRTYYDLEGKALRTEQNPAQVEYVTEYYLDRHTGEVKSERRPVRQLYVVKKGLRFDKKTGQFTDTATGNAVAARDAVVQIRQ